MLALKNHCFSLLPDHVRQAVRPHLSLLTIPKGVSLSSVISESVVFFPITAVLAITAVTEGESGSFLRFAGAGVAVGVNPSKAWRPVRSEARVCGAGYVFSVPAARLWSFVASPTNLEESRFKLVSSVADRALLCSYCSAHHSFAQRLATLLLAAADEFGEDRQISFSQEEISQWLAVRRETVASVLAEWSSHGIVETGRVKLCVKNRSALQTKACSCYQNAMALIKNDLDSWSSLLWQESSIVKSSSYHSAEMARNCGR